MGHTTNMTLLGLGPRVLSQPRIAGLALSRLNASAKAAALVLGDKGKKIRRLTTEFIRAARSNNAAQALVARRKLERLLAGLSAQEIKAIHDRARGRRTSSAIDRFTLFDRAAVGRILANANEDDLQLSQVSLAKLAAQAVMGTTEAKITLQQMTSGKSPTAQQARALLDYLKELRRMEREQPIPWLPTDQLTKMFALTIASSPAKDIKGVVELAAQISSLLAIRVGFYLEIDVPKNILISRQEDREIMMNILMEIITNAIKYRNPKKADPWAKIKWDSLRRRLTVADNGLGIQDTEAVWREGYRERPDVAEGGGEGLPFIRRQLEAIGWKIEVESTPGEGTTFTLIPPADGITYDQGYLQNCLAQQRAYFQTHGQFDLATLIPEVVVQMTSGEQLALGKRLFRAIYQLCLEFNQAIEKLAENNVENLRKLAGNLARDIGYLDKLFPNPSDSNLGALIIDMRTSATQLSYRITEMTTAVIDLFKVEYFTWQEAIRAIPRATDSQKLILTGVTGYRYNTTQEAFTVSLVSWLLAHQPRATSGNESRWTLQYPKICEISPASLPFSGLTNSPWPPDPENDIVLKTYLELLGWKMTVEETPEHVVVRVDFGKSVHGGSQTWRIREIETRSQFMGAATFESTSHEGLPDLAPEVFQARVIEHRSALEQLGFKVDAAGILEIGTPEEFIERLRATGAKDMEAEDSPIGYLQQYLPDGTHISVFASMDGEELGDLRSTNIGKNLTAHLTFDRQGQIQKAVVHIALEIHHIEERPAGKILGEMGYDTIVAPVGDRIETLFGFVLEPSTPN